MTEDLRGERVRQASTFLVRSRLPRRIAPDYAAASYTPRPPRRLLLTGPAAPSPPPPRDAPSLAARAAVPPSASHRLPTPARRYSRCHRGGRETRPLLPIPHPCPARDRPPSLLARERPALACSPIAARLQSERRGRERARRRPRLDAHAAACCPVGAALLSPAEPSRSTSLR